jgi:hypothetical protein
MHHVMVIMSFGTHPTDVLIIIIIIIISQPASQPRDRTIELLLADALLAVRSS